MFSMKTWDEETSDETTVRFASEIAKKFFARMGPEDVYSTFVDNRRFDSILESNPSIFTEPEVYRNFVGGLGLLKKLPCLPLNSEPRLSAVKKFLSGEVGCRETNRIFNLWKRGEFQFRPAVESILHAAQRKICKIVGPVPHPSQVRYRFSPGGASTSTKKKDSEIRNLIANLNHCSEELASDPLLGEILQTVPGLLSFLSESSGSSDSFLCTVHRSRLDFVPKDASTDRIITVEPDLNKFVQNGYGDYLRLMCKRSGIDLSDQTRNGELARIGSITNGIATVDLSNASGLLSLGLIEHLWPCEWFELLMSIRSGYTAYDGFIFHMEAYAGMGNGTTFPVESITFHALSEAVCDFLGLVGPVSTYGDDIIVPSDAVPMLVSVFRDLGLSVNAEKSFWDGPFRESCGQDWFLGFSVRPAFLRGNVSFRRLYLLHNHYYRLGDFEAAGWFLDYIPEHFRTFGPDGYGDGHLLGTWRGEVYYHESEEILLARRCVCEKLGLDHGSECYTKKRVKTRTSMYKFRTYGYGSRKYFYVSKADYLIPSYTIYMGASSVNTTRSPSWLKGSDLQKFIDKNLGVRDVVVESVLASSFSSRRKLRRNELPPDSSVWAIGTPMPGTQGCRRLTVCTFERPSSF